MSSTGTIPFTIVIASGKGGVGKSVIAANLAATLLNHQSSILLFDANLHHPTLHLLFNADPPLRLHQYQPGETNPEQIASEILPGLALIAGLPAHPAPSQETVIEVLTHFQHSNQYSLILVDTASGITPELTTLVSHAQLLLLVTTDEPTAIVDSYGLLKFLLQQTALPLTGLLANMIVDPEDAHRVEQTLNAATQRFLNLHLPLLGFIPYDRTVRRAILNQTLLNDFDPFASSSRAFVQLSTTLFRFIDSVQKSALTR